MKYDGIVLYSDMDGTLLNNERQLSQENLNAISYFVSQGGRFGVATGRMNRTTIVSFPELPINTPSIFFNGATVFDTQSQKLIYSTFMPEGLEPIFQDILERYTTSSVEINVIGKAYVNRINDIIRIQIEREGLIGVEAPLTDIPERWIKALVADKHDILVKVKKDLDALNRTDINIMFSEAELLDIVAQGVSKGAALSYLKRSHGKDWRLVVAVGDNDNDLEMIREADVGIAVANARSGVKEAAKHEIAHHNTPCIPQVLEILESYL